MKVEVKTRPIFEFYVTKMVAFYEDEDDNDNLVVEFEGFTDVPGEEEEEVRLLVNIPKRVLVELEHVLKQPSTQGIHEH